MSPQCVCPYLVFVATKASLLIRKANEIPSSRSKLKIIYYVKSKMVSHSEKSLHAPQGNRKFWSSVALFMHWVSEIAS